MKLFSKEIVVINSYTQQIKMRFEYKDTQQHIDIMNIVSNMNECAKLNNSENEYYTTHIIYGVDYENN